VFPTRRPAFAKLRRAGQSGGTTVLARVGFFEVIVNLLKEWAKPDLSC
jgi:hypothetical protein